MTRMHLTNFGMSPPRFAGQGLIVTEVNKWVILHEVNAPEAL
jgi:hypothetical protein